MALISALRAALHSKDVSIEFGLNPVLYSTIQHYWKDSTREALVEELAKAAWDARRRGAQQVETVVKTLLSALPAAWKEERSNLERRILEQLGL